MIIPMLDKAVQTSSLYALESDLDPVAQLFVNFSQAFIANQV